MKTFRKTVSLLFAILLCASATVAASAETYGVNTVDGSVLSFEALKGDVNIDGYLNLKDVVRFKKYSVDDTVDFDTEVADYNADEAYNGADIALLQTDVINTLFA